MDLKMLEDVPPWEWPRGTGKIIRQTLMDKRADESARVTAAGLAGDITVMDEDMAKALLEVLRNPQESEEIRTRAAISFGPILEEGHMLEFDDPDDVAITEEMFDEIRGALHEIYQDTSLAKELRRRVLEGSVRAPDSWHTEAVRAAYTSGDRDWKLTAVFAMRYITGFDDEILESLKSTDKELHYEAVQAAAEFSVAGAWSHVLALVQNRRTPKPLLLAAIAAVGSIRPAEAQSVLARLGESRDEEISEAVSEALSMAAIDQELLNDEEEDDDEDEDEEDEEDSEGLPN